jgi:RNA polymerase sigma-70 factor (ECF subfamily)
MLRYEHLPEQVLLKNLQGDDVHALTEIYNRYVEKLLAIGFYYSRNKETAEDIVHEIFLSLWAKRKELHIHSLENYLGTAVKFAIFKYIAREKRRRDILAGLAEEAQVSEEVEAKLEEKFLQDYLKGSIEQLPEKARLVFRYSRNENLTIQEISGKMDLSPKAVEYHMTKALRFIRETLKKLSVFI